MSWSDWLKAALSFILLVTAIIVFQQFKLDTNFLITFILAIVSIVISITFFISSNNVSLETKNMIHEAIIRIQNLSEKFGGESKVEKISDIVEIPNNKENE